MNSQLVYHHSPNQVYDHRWTVELFPDGVQVQVQYFPVVMLTWEQLTHPEILIERFGFMHVTGFSILVERLAQVFQNQLADQS